MFSLSLSLSLSLSFSLSLSIYLSLSFPLSLSLSLFPSLPPSLFLSMSVTVSSSKHQLPFMILTPQTKLQQMGFPPENVCPTEKSGISKPRFCQTYVLQFGAFHENGGNHAKMTKMTKTTQTATSKGVDCWICGKHGNDENHGHPGCKT